MGPAAGRSRDDLLSEITATLRSVRPDLGVPDAGTRLTGSEAVLDSVGFVTLLIALEQNLGNSLDLAASFLEVGGSEGESNPFHTVGSLADHIHRLSSREG